MQAKASIQACVISRSMHSASTPPPPTPPAAAVTRATVLWTSDEAREAEGSLSVGLLPRTQLVLAGSSAAAAAAGLLARRGGYIDSVDR